MATELERLFVRFEGRMTELESALKKVDSRTRSSQQRVEKGFDRAFARVEGRAKAFAGRMQGALGALGVGIGGAALGREIRGTVAEAAKLFDVAQKVGQSTDALQELRIVAEQVGVQFGQTDTGLQRFSRRIGQAAEGSGELAPIIDRLGIALRDSDGRLRSNEDLLNEYADAIKNAETDQERLLLTFKAFDTEGAGLVNILRDGSEGLAAMRANARATGQVLDSDVIAKGKEIDSAWTEVMRKVDTRWKGFILEGLAGLDLLRNDIARIGETPIEFAQRDLEAARAKVDRIAEAWADVQNEIRAAQDELAALNANASPGASVDTRIVGRQVVGPTTALEKRLEALQERAAEISADFAEVGGAVLVQELSTITAAAAELQAQMERTKFEIAAGAKPPQEMDALDQKLVDLQKRLGDLRQQAELAGGGFAAAFEAAAQAVAAVTGAVTEAGNAAGRRVTIHRGGRAPETVGGGAGGAGGITREALDAAAETIAAGFETSTERLGITVTKPLGDIFNAQQGTEDASRDTAAAVDGLGAPIGSVESAIGRLPPAIGREVGERVGSILEGSFFAGGGRNPLEGASIGIQLDKFLDFTQARLNEEAQAEISRLQLETEAIARFGDKFPSASTDQLADLLRAERGVSAVGFGSATGGLFTREEANRIAEGLAPDESLTLQLIRLQEEANRLLRGDEGGGGDGGLISPLVPISQAEANLVAFGQTAQARFGSFESSRAAPVINDNSDRRTTVVVEGDLTERIAGTVVRRFMEALDDQSARDLGSRLDAVGF